MISQVLLDNLPELFFSTDTMHCLDWVSGYADELCGYSASRLTGRPLSYLFADSHAYEEVCHQVRCLPRDTVYRCEIALLCSNGELRRVELSLCARADSYYRYLGLEGRLRDLSAEQQLEQQLLDTEERFRRLSEQGTDAVLIHHQGGLLDCNPQAEALFGYPLKELRRMQVLDLISRADRDRARQHLEQELEHSWQGEGRRLDGSKFPMTINVSSCQMAGRRVRVCSIQDLTGQYQNTRRHRLLDEVISASPVAVLVLDAQGRLEYANPSVQQLTGYSQQQLIEMSAVTGLFCAEQGPDVRWLDWKLLIGQAWQGTLKLKRQDGTVTPVSARLSAVRDEQHNLQHQTLLLEDRSVQEAHDLLLHQRSFDPLTGLPEREQAQIQMEQLLSQARDTDTRAVLLSINLDEFRAINDALGYRCGDQLLQAVSQRLQSECGRNHCLTRFAADEFLLMVSDIRSSTEVEALAERLQKIFESPFATSERELTITASMGLALYPLDGSDLPGLLRCASTAMAKAKREGRSGYSFFNNQMNHQVLRRLEIERQLHGVLERQELELNYQPVIDFNSGELQGAEALLRWRNPELGFVSPVQFIPVAESTGQIVSIGNWVLQEACRQASAWQQQGIALKIAVNVSPRQFSSDLPDLVERALQHSGLSPEYLQIEVTEGLLLSHSAETRRIFHQLRSLGVQIAIDDFGTGYSSLAYLESFAFDTLKIDRSFVADMTPGSRRDTLVSNIINMAHGLALKVVAEGVENPQQEDRLLALGCDFAQGYHYSRPLTASAFNEYLQQAVVRA
ncbi:MAG: EAL domain-containing protein [Marinobacterium sp.]|nr:EAL domain-containing protein [Marinobacterium sp.]